MAEEIEVPVVIVGGGPVGLTLSYILGKNDIKHVLLEQNDTTTKWPKAILTNTRSMELYRRLGIKSYSYSTKIARNVCLPWGYCRYVATLKWAQCHFKL